MLKAKVSLWTTVLIILIIASGIISWIKTNDLSAIGGKEITVSIDSKYSADITNNIADKKIGSYKVKIGNNNPSVIIKDTSDTVMEGYEKHANAVYSPIVLYVRNEAYDHQNGFVTISTKGGISALKVDLRKILDAMLNEKTWGDIGINEKVAKGTVNLVIPNERSPYWNDFLEAKFNGKNEELIKKVGRNNMRKIRDIFISCNCLETVDTYSQRHYAESLEKLINKIYLRRNK